MTMVRRVVALVAAVAVVLVATPASAHITVNPRTLPKGEFAKLAFRVPNERDDAGTVRVEVNFPREHPFAFFNVRPVPGWQSSVERSTLDKPLVVFGRTVTEAVTKITWEGGTVNPGGFEEFEVSVGPLPREASQLVFKAIQTYSSGEIVRWIEEREPGATEDPEHPAPVLKLTAAAPEGAASGDAAAGRPAAVATKDDVDDAKRLSAMAIALAVLATAGAVAGFLRRRVRPPASAPTSE